MTIYTFLHHERGFSAMQESPFRIAAQFPPQPHSVHTPDCQTLTQTAQKQRIRIHISVCGFQGHSRGLAVNNYSSSDNRFRIFMQCPITSSSPPAPASRDAKSCVSRAAHRHSVYITIPMHLMHFSLVRRKILRLYQSGGIPLNPSPWTI